MHISVDIFGLTHMLRRNEKRFNHFTQPNGAGLTLYRGYSAIDCDETLRINKKILLFIPFTELTIVCQRTLN
jgi:hypothetical protein